MKLAACICVLVGAISLTRSLVETSGTPLSVSAVEWLRTHGARPIVNTVENLYYTFEAPSKGGPAARSLPRQPGQALSASARATTRARNRRQLAALSYRPKNIKPVISPAVRGEGVWRATFAEAGLKSPPVLITTYRPDPSYPSIFVGLAWINHRVTNVQYYPGLQEPSVTLPSRGPAEIPPDMRSNLVASFNSGFQLVDSNGGVVVHGKTYAAMRDGQGTFVKYTNGKVNVVDWTGGAKAGANVVYARQNLPLLVDNGKPSPLLSNANDWGATLGNAVMVWRSAVGIDKYGNLIYTAGDYQTAQSLARILIHAGAVRGMELDINAEWPSFITYSGPGAAGAANLLPAMWNSPQRYLTPDDRDFYAVYLDSSDLRTSTVAR